MNFYGLQKDLNNNTVIFLSAKCFKGAKKEDEANHNII